jgi:formate dehydrogenase subunit gamma
LGTDASRHVVRYNRRSRLLHTATFLVTGVLLFTGWWIWSGHEGRPSLLARIAGEPDVELHRRAGWALVVLGAVAVTVGIRGAWSFLRETVRIDRGDGRWFLRWPVGALTGRFARHRGHFDPGQRIANVAFLVTLGTLIGTGVALTTLHGGPTFVYLVRAHRYATYALVVLVAVHVVLAVGVLPGYRGAWRSMHLGGRTPRATAERLWPDDTERRSPTVRDVPTVLPAASRRNDPGPRTDVSQGPARHGRRTQA